MGAGSHSVSCTLGGRSLTRTATTSGENDTLLGGTASPITLTAGTTVLAWVKTDSDTASCQLSDGHGLTSGKFDVYSSAGVCYRYGVQGTVTNNDLALDGGSAPLGGSGFPDSEAAGVIVCKQQQINVSIDGDNAALVGMLATCPAHLDMRDGDNDTIREVTLAEDEPDIWDSGQAVNPYTGDSITNIRLSNGSTSSGTIQIVVSQTALVVVSASSSPSSSVSSSPSTSPSPSSSASSSPSASVSSSPSESPSASASSSPSSTA
jgi:hypothetical protein